jgi:hypothetical protein
MKLSKSAIKSAHGNMKRAWAIQRGKKHTRHTMARKRRSGKGASKKSNGIGKYAPIIGVGVSILYPLLRSKAKPAVDGAVSKTNLHPTLKAHAYSGTLALLGTAGKLFVKNRIAKAIIEPIQSVEMNETIKTMQNGNSGSSTSSSSSSGDIEMF